MTSDVFRLIRPAHQDTSVIFASPHSGRDYHAAFMRQSQLNIAMLRSSEDAYVDLLLDAAPSIGAPLLAAIVPRAFIDMNRAADELDPAVIDGISGSLHNPRISSGLGVIPRVVAGARAIYSGKMTRPEADQRIAQYWIPYHQALRDLIEQTFARFGQVVVIDCHSMPHEAIENHTRSGASHPDVVLGDRFGTSAGPEVVDRIESAFASAGLRVARNAPFAGAFIAQKYGRPALGQHVVQIELDRALYLDEKSIQPGANFDSFKQVLTNIMAEIAVIGRIALPLAAE